MLPQERYRKLMEYLQENGIIKMDTLMDMFDISIETARRDLNHLEKEGLIKKIYGGATIVEKVTREPANAERLASNINEKEAIGRKCAEFIEDGDSIMLEVGTTVLQIAKAVKEKKNLTVITNSLPVVQELIDTDFQLYIIGGRIRHDEGAISGAVSMFEMSSFHINKAFIGAGGITLKNGISDFDIEESLVRRKIIEQSGEVFLAADSSKFGRDVLARIAPLDSVDLIITDDKIKPSLLSEFEEAGMNVVLA